MGRRLLGAAVVGCSAVVAALLLAAPSSAQQPVYRPDPHLDPDDQLAPSQITQPMPVAVPQPTAAPRKSTPPAKRTEATADLGPAPKRPPPTPPRPAIPARPASPTLAVTCSGPFAKNSNMPTLAETYDPRNMTYEERDVEGSKVGITVLFPKDPQRRLEIWWTQPNRSGVYLIDIEGKSTWAGPQGLQLGEDLLRLQRLNRKPFRLSGFNSNGVANVRDWNGGALDALPGGCKAGVSLRASTRTRTASALPAADQYNSNDPALRAFKPAISEILIGY